MHPGRARVARAWRFSWLSLAAACTSTRHSSVVAPTSAQTVDAATTSTAGSSSQSVESAPKVPDEPAPSSPPAWARGRIDTRIVARRSDGDEDLDLFSVLSLDLGQPRDAWSGHVSARAAWDADGRSREFPSLADADGRPVSSQVYDAYVRTRGLGFVEELTLGRQFLYDTPIVAWFDGIELHTTERGARRWRTGFYAGVPVHPIDSDATGDLLVGLFEQVRARDDLRLRADWLHVQDQRLNFDGHDDLFSVSAQYDPRPEFRAEAAYSRLGGEDRDVRVQASWTDYEAGWTLNASWRRLLERQTQRALELDPFFDTLFQLEPYDQARVLFAKDLGDTTHLDLGVDVRRLIDGGVEGAFNHEFERYFATTTFDELLPAGVVLALTGEVWDGSTADFETWGVDLSKRWAKRWDASLGSSYSLFKFDPLDGSECEDVRTYYASARCKLNTATTLSLRAEFEDNAVGDFGSLRGGATWRF